MKTKPSLIVWPLWVLLYMRNQICQGLFFSGQLSQEQLKLTKLLLGHIQITWPWPSYLSSMTTSTSYSQLECDNGMEKLNGYSTGSIAAGYFQSGLNAFKDVLKIGSDVGQSSFWVFPVIQQRVQLVV